MYDEALKSYKQLESKGDMTDELKARISKVETIIANDDKLYISENEDKKTLKSIKFSESITYRDKKSSKSSKASLRKIHKALEGINSSDDKVSDEEKQIESPDSVNDENIDKPIKEKTKIKLTKCKFDTTSLSNEFINSLDEVKKYMKEQDSDTPKQLDTFEDEDEKRTDLEDYEQWSQNKCNKILRNNPKNEKAYFRLGVLLVKENPIKARAWFQECQEIDPEFRTSDILELIGDCIFYNEKEDISKAIAFYEDATKLNSESPILSIKQGRWYEKLKEYNTALTFYKRAVDLSGHKTAIPLFRLGWWHIRNNDLTKGIETLKAAIEIEPNNAEILNKLGETLLRLEKDEVLDEAKEYIQRSVKIDSSSYEAYLNLGRVYRKKDNTQFSIKWFEKALRRTKEPSNAYFYLAEAFEKSNEEDRAIKLYKQCLSADKNHFRALVFYATLLTKRREIHKACKYYRHALKVQPENLYVHFSLGKLLFKSEETKKIALKHFKFILKKDPEFYKAKYMISLISTEKENKKKK